jgi:protein-S-isoprenylcysteine O-methyltransferase Ste14
MYAKILISASILLLAAYIIFRIIVRRDYHQQGRLSPLSTILESLIWLPFFLFPYLYNSGSWPAFWQFEATKSRLITISGIFLMILRVFLGLSAIAWFGFRCAFGQQVDRLVQDGPYRLSCNLQVVGFTPLVLGIALRWPSRYAAGWVLLYTAMIHMMVITEEEHLRRIYAAGYIQYCRRVPIYVGMIKHA